MSDDFDRNNGALDDIENEQKQLGDSAFSAVNNARRMAQNNHYGNQNQQNFDGNNSYKNPNPEKSGDNKNKSNDGKSNKSSDNKNSGQQGSAGSNSAKGQEGAKAGGGAAKTGDSVAKNEAKKKGAELAAEKTGETIASGGSNLAVYAVLLAIFLFFCAAAIAIIAPGFIESHRESQAHYSDLKRKIKTHTENTEKFIEGVEEEEMSTYDDQSPHYEAVNALINGEEVKSEFNEEH